MNREIWHPPGARGIYGGAVIAQSLAAAQQTIPPPLPENGNAEFLIHSMHCYFVLAGDATIPVIYHVEKVRDGKSFITRTVQARQKGKCIFTTTLSFMRETNRDERTVNHAWNIPEGAVERLGDFLGDESGDEDKEDESLGVESSGAFVSKKMGIENSESCIILLSEKTRLILPSIKVRQQILITKRHANGSNAAERYLKDPAPKPTSQLLHTCPTVTLLVPYPVFTIFGASRSQKSTGT